MDPRQNPSHDWTPGPTGHALKQGSDQQGLDLCLCEQVINEGCKSRDYAAGILSAFKRDYPTLVRAVKTRETAQTVLMHKLRFIKSMCKAGLLEEKEKNLMLVRFCPTAVLQSQGRSVAACSEHPLLHASWATGLAVRSA